MGTFIQTRQNFQIRGIDMKKRTISFILTIILMILCMSNVRADSNLVDLTKKGSINITLSTNDNEAIKDAELTIYKVGDAVIEKSNLLFKNVSEIESCNVDFTKITDKNISGSVLKCIQNSNVKQEKLYTDEHGKVSFKNLELGLYLVVQTNDVKGYSKIDSYLIMIPEEVDNEWNYDISSLPKTEIYSTIDIEVIKIWNKQNQNSKLPDAVTIELLKADEVIDTVILNKENNWTYTWFDIEKSDNYSVREINIPSGYTATYKNDNYTFTVTNTDKLPQTGRSILPIIILFVSGVFFIILSLYQLKIEENEK